MLSLILEASEVLPSPAKNGAGLVRGRSSTSYAWRDLLRSGRLHLRELLAGGVRFRRSRGHREQHRCEVQRRILNHATTASPLSQRNSAAVFRIHRMAVRVAVCHALNPAFMALVCSRWLVSGLLCAVC